MLSKRQVFVLDSANPSKVVSYLSRPLGTLFPTRWVQHVLDRSTEASGRALYYVREAVWRDESDIVRLTTRAGHRLAGHPLDRF